MRARPAEPARVLWLAALLLLLSPAIAAAAPDPLVVGQAAPRLNIAPAAQYLADPDGGLAPRSLPGGSGWQPMRQEVPNFGYSEAAYWFRFGLRNPTAERLDRLLEVGYPLLDHVDVYVSRADGSLRHYRSGDRLPFGERPIAHRHFVFPLSLPAGETLEVLLRVQSTSSTQVPLTLWEPSAFAAQTQGSVAAHALYAGIMLAMVLYNLFIYVSIRVRTYLYYVVFISCSGLLFMELNGLTFQFLWPSALWWQEHGIALLLSAMPPAGAAFAASFLNLRRHSRRLPWLLGLVAAVGVLNFIAVPFTTYPVSIRVAVFNILAWIGLMVWSGLYAWYKGETAARYYLAAWALFLTSAFLTSVYQFGVLPKALVGEYTLQLGSALEALLLSFGLADRIAQMRREKDRAQRDALQNLQRYQTLYQQAPYGIFTTSVEGEGITANPAALRLLGYASIETFRAEVRDVARDLYVRPLDRQRMLALLAEQGAVSGFETQLRRRDGTPVWVAISARVTEGSRLEGSMTDITERKERERAERAAALAEKERQAATAAAEAKTAFLSNMSHEIRTPLTAVIGYGEHLLQPNLSEEQRHGFAATIVRSGRHLLGLLNDILDLSKVEAGRLEVERIPANLFELLADVQSVFQVRAREQGLHFALDYQWPLPNRISTDPTRFKQILYNLCGNALKFTERGGVSVAVAYQAPAGLLRVAVEDTGIGIPPDKLEGIFEAFTQADVSTTRRHGGTGLGLAISAQLAERLGGRLSCRSRPGEGSCFELVLPAAAEELVGGPDQARWSEQDADEVVVPRLGGSVLHAEDNPESRHLVAMLVEATGARLVTAADGREAVARAQREAFDLVLLDVQMPVMDGFGALAALRNLGYAGPVVALTANVMAEERARYRAAGFSDCQPKPVDRPGFYALLARYLPPAVQPPRGEVRGRVLVAVADPAQCAALGRRVEAAGARYDALGDGRGAVERALAGDYQLILLAEDLPQIDGPEAAELIGASGCAAPIYLLGAGPADALALRARAAGCAGALALPPEAAEIEALLARHLPPPAAGEAAALRQGVAALAERFRASLPQTLETLQQAAAQADWTAVGELAHQLKGSGGSFGHPELSRLGAELQAAAEAGRVQLCRRLVAELAQCAAQASASASSLPS